MWQAFWCGGCSSKLTSGISELAQPAWLQTNSERRRGLNLHACGWTGPQMTMGLISRGLFQGRSHSSGFLSRCCVAWLSEIVRLKIFLVSDLLGGRKKETPLDPACPCLRWQRQANWASRNLSLFWMRSALRCLLFIQYNKQINKSCLKQKHRPC